MKNREYNITIVIISMVVLILTAISFIYKMAHFVMIALSGEAVGFATIPIVNYIMAGSGFLLLLLWAFLTGQFRDIEGPKYRMLQLEKEYDLSADRQGEKGIRNG